MREFNYQVTKEDMDLSYDVKDIIRKRFPFSSRLRKKIKFNKSVYLNGEQVQGWIHPSFGDKITIGIPDETSHFAPKPIPINPVYEDEDLLIINKLPGYVVHPTRSHYEDTIANGVAQYMLDTNQSFKIRFINRLDMDTSGVLLLGKNSHAQDDFVKQVKMGGVKKLYRAIVCGVIEEERGTIDLPIGFESPDSPRRCVCEDGKPSLTGYRVIDRFTKGKGYTLVELELFTGRTHQIRVHMKHIGHPVLGDPLYSEERVYLIQRQALHAYSLAFNHPVSKKALKVTAPLPKDMEELIKKIK